MISIPIEEQKIAQKYLSKNGSMGFNLALNSLDNCGLVVEVVATKVN